jgi:hypothetical protein
MRSRNHRQGKHGDSQGQREKHCVSQLVLFSFRLVLCHREDDERAEE